MRTPPPRGRFQGVAQILRFNWPMYAAAVVVLTAGAAVIYWIPLPSLVRAAAFTGLGLAAFWLLVSLAVSHYIYDVAGIYRDNWLVSAMPQAPRRYVNLHAGLDEFSSVLEKRFPNAERRILDFFDPQGMTEPSITRARKLARDQPVAEHVDFRALPVGDDALDAAFLIFAAHELREPESRVELLRELRRSLAANGRIVVVEHLRDVPNLLAF
ncbi:MAG TPA: methyltransferase domain-containing protein, partial [Chthoniobacterales bacterium]|nr:methyltransferase domain-containing protein [Chthoniobacterales bacterium]